MCVCLISFFYEYTLIFFYEILTESYHISTITNFIRDALLLVKESI